MDNIIPDTVCINCCFAEWDGITQTDCKRGKIDTYKQNGSEVLECHNGEKEFYVVKGRACPFFRNQKWHDMMKDEEHIEARLQLETRMNYLAVVFANNNLDGLLETIYSLEAQELKPAEVRIIQQKGNMIPPGEIVRATKDVNLFIRIESHTRTIGREESIHLAYKFTKTKCQFISVWEAGTEVAQDFYSTINWFVVDNLEQFAAIIPERGKYDGLVLPESVHMYWYFNGDPKKTILENVRRWECVQQQSVCYKMQDLRLLRMKKVLQ